MRPEICINSNLNPFTKFTNSSRSTELSSQGASWHGICLFIACQQRVIKTFTGPGYFCSEDGVVWLWHDMVNLHIYSSPFYLATAQSQYALLIRRDGGLSTLCLSYWFACQQRVLKTFLGPGYLCYQDGGSLTVAFLGIYKRYKTYTKLTFIAVHKFKEKCKILPPTCWTKDHLDWGIIFCIEVLYRSN